MDVGAGSEHPGLVRLGGSRSARSAVTEHGIDPLGAADVDVVGDECLEEPAGPAGVVEHQGLGHLDLAHRELPPVAAGPFVVGERGGDDVDPAVEERLHVAGPEPVTDLLQPVGAVAGSEPVAQRPVVDAGLVGLALGPLVAVDPHLGRIREVGADLDEPGPEVGIPHVEVVGPHAPFGLRPVEPHSHRRAGLLGRAEDPLELLGGDDRDHAVVSGPLGRFEIGADVVELAIIPTGAIRLLQLQDRNLVGRGERFDLASEPGAELLDHCWRRDRLPEVLLAEPLDLTTHLQVGHVRVQIQTIDTVDLQADVTIEHLVDVHHGGHAHDDAPTSPPRPPSQTRRGRGPGGGPALPPLKW